MEQIKPKEITLTSNSCGVEVKKEFRLGRYPATEGVEIFGMALELIPAMMKPSTESNVSGKKMREGCVKLASFAEAKSDSGDWIRLDKEFLVNAHVHDYETLMRLAREVHEWNSNFFSTGRLLEASLGMMKELKLQAFQMLSQFSGSSSVKKSPRSKS